MQGHFFQTYIYYIWLYFLWHEGCRAANLACKITPLENLLCGSVSRHWTNRRRLLLKNTFLWKCTETFFPLSPIYLSPHFWNDATRLLPNPFILVFTPSAYLLPTPPWFLSSSTSCTSPLPPFVLLKMTQVTGRKWQRSSCSRLSSWVSPLSLVVFI